MLFTIDVNPIVTHFFAQSQASGTALFWAIHMYCVSVFSTPQYAHVQAIFGKVSTAKMFFENQTYLWFVWFFLQNELKIKEIFLPWKAKHTERL